MALLLHTHDAALKAAKQSGILGKKQRGKTDTNRPHLERIYEKGAQRIETDPRLERIKEKLHHVHQYDPTCRAFGVEKHRYHLNPRVSSQHLDQLEQRYQISFPEDYRHFLQEVGNGGAGPYYGGLFPVEKSLQVGLSMDDWAVSDDPGPADFFELPFIPPAEVSYLESWETLSSLRGLLPLADMGDGGYVHLVVSGPERGHVWGTWDQGWVWPERSSWEAIPTEWRSAPHGPDFINFLLSPAFTDRVSFLQWYEQWLDQIPYLVRLADSLQSRKPPPPPR